jgi:hypothetical protein
MRQNRAKALQVVRTSPAEALIRILGWYRFSKIVARKAWKKPLALWHLRLSAEGLIGLSLLGRGKWGLGSTNTGHLVVVA